MSSEDDNVRTDEYWMGVRDALRMVDSFNKWSKRNPGRAKSLEDFIHDGLIAAAKRCESCLRDKLGLSFAEVEEDENEIATEDSIKHEDDDKKDDVTFEESIETDEEPQPSFEEPISHIEAEMTPTSEVSDESPISLDSVERLVDEEMEDLSIEGPPREFSTDFELVEPTPLVVDETSIQDAPAETEPEPEPEPELDEAMIDEIEPEPDSEELPDKPSFTWSEYEEAVTPSSEPEPLNPEEDIIPSEDEEVSMEIESEIAEEPPEPPKVWSPYAEPSISEEDSEDETISEPELVDEDEGEAVITEPPSPPPPD